MTATNDLYARFFRDAPDAVIVADLDGVVVDANDQATVLFGYDLDALIGLSVETLLPDRFRSEHRKLRSEYSLAPERRPMGAGLDLWARHRDGSEFPVDVSLSPAMAWRGQVTLAAVRDVTARRTAEQEAHQWTELFERVDWGVVISSADGRRIERMNPAFAAMHGYTIEELAGRPVDVVFAPTAHETLADHLDAVQELGHHSFESVHVRRDGATFPVMIDASAIRDERGRLRYRAAHVTDISGRAAAEAALRQSESRFRHVFEDAPMGMALLDRSLCILRPNDALCSILGYDHDALVGRTFGSLTPAEDVRRAEELAERMFAGDLERFTVEKRLLDATGRIVWVELHVSLLEHETPGQAIAMVMDVTTRKQLEAELTHRATHDPLTGLPNRALLEDRVRLAQARSDRTAQLFGVLFVDLDGFKAINDESGHTRGDAVLAEIGHRIRRAVRPADTAARVGGDEFVVLCEDLGGAEDDARRTASDVARRVIDAIGLPITLQGTTVIVTASIGILVTGDTQRSPTALLALADAAMYLAKSRSDHAVAFADGTPPES